MDILRKINKIKQTALLKSIIFNFHYLPFQQAIHLPILLGRRTYLAHMGGSIVLEGPIKRGIIHIGYRRIGFQDKKYDRTKWHVSGKVIFHGNGIVIGMGTDISVAGTLEIERNVCITGASTIICLNHISLGKKALISWDVLLMDTDFHPIEDLENGKILNPDKPITIGDDVWIGCRASILKGSVIPNGCVVAASSVISRKLEKENCVYRGDGYIIREGIKWHHFI